MTDDESGRAATPRPDADRIRAALRQVVDPEVGLDVVTMGLIYGVDVEDGSVRIRHTLTTEGCPMETVITRGIEYAARQVPGVETVKTELVWEPRWHPGMMEEDPR